MARKIKVGDWFLYRNPPERAKEVLLAEEIEGDSAWIRSGNYWYGMPCCTKLPASPAVLAKSHRLLIRYHHVKAVGETIRTLDAIDAHCRRIAKGKKK